MKYFKVSIGILFILSVFYAYYGDYNLMYELTCISNLLAGSILIIDGTLMFFKKKMPVEAYLFILPAISFVYLISTLLTTFNIVNFNFSGGFLVLHAITPIVFLLMFLFITDRLKIESKKKMVTSILIYPVVFMAYLLFDLIRFFIVGEFVYGILDKDMVYFTPLVGILMYGLAIAMTFGLIKLKEFTVKKMNK